MAIAMRFPLATLPGVVLTGLMFWFLWTMIMGGAEPIVLQKTPSIEFRPLRRDTDTPPVRPAKPEQPPIQILELPPISTTPNPAGPTIATERERVVVSDTGPISIGVGSDGDVIPMVRISPEYPLRAKTNGTEGWVQFEFTVTAAGTVSNVKVIDAEPKGVFEDAATKAIQRWKYNPKVVEGQAVERRGVRVVLRFDLED